MTAAVDTVVANAKGLVDAITRADCGQMVAGQWMGGGGGLLSRETLLVADALRLALDTYRQEQEAAHDAAAAAAVEGVAE